MNQLAKIETTQFDEVVKNSGLAIQEGEESKLAYLPFLSDLSEIQQQASKINFDNPVDIDEKISRELRLKTVKIRTSAEALKDSRKKMHLLKGNLEQAAYNLIAASCKVTEETFFNIEKARELKEKKRRESLRIERLEKLMSVCEDASIYPLGDISEDAFNDLYLGMLSQKEAKLKAEKEAEEKRLAEIEAEKKRQAERDAENLRLKKEAELREIEIEKERQKQAEILAKQKAESEKKAKEEKEKAEAKEKQLVAERAKAESERKKIEEAAKKEREEADRKLKAEQEKARIEAEKAKAEKDKLEAELKAEADKKENERKAKEAAEKKAKNAPDKEKLLEFAINIDNIAIPEIKSEEAQKILADVKMLLSKVSVFIREKSSGL